MWVKLLVAKTVEVRGKSTRFYAGDWVDVGKQLALQWLADGDAEIPVTSYDAVTPIGSGVVFVAADSMLVRDFKSKFGDAEVLNVPEPGPEIPFVYTMYLSGKVPFRYALVPAGYGLLETWEIAVPLWDYNQLACDVGSDQDRAATKAVIRDLRVPLYDTRVMFVRRTPSTQAVFKRWSEERGCIDSADTRLAFLRALYAVKPLVLALPTTWSSSQSKNRHDAQ